jgi:2-methylcitrate dehydratase
MQQSNSPASAASGQQAITSPKSNQRPPYDKELVAIADYVLDFQVTNQKTIDIARLRLTDTLACALDALSYPDCTKLLGPVVPGTHVPHGARVPGTPFQLDPVKATFDIGCMIRWLDFNDTFTAAQGSHPSDNLAGVLTVADHLSRKRVASGGKPLVMRDVLDGLVKTYEIQGCIAIENDFNEMNVDHVILCRVATAGVVTQMLGGGKEEILNAVSNAWIDTSIRVYRQAPNAGWRKSWAAPKATSEGVTLALMAMKGEMGYPSVLTARKWGFYDRFRDGKPFEFQRLYGDYVIQNSMFKFVPAGMHGQSAVECALRLHPLVKARLSEIELIEITSQRALMGIMDKTGPLHNPADRDHSVQYIVAIGLIFGRMLAEDFEDEVARDPRIDALRDKMTVTEDLNYSRDFYDPQKRSSANAVQIRFKDGSSTPKIEVEYPFGHPRRLAEAGPVLRAKFEHSLNRRYPARQRDQVLSVCDGRSLDAMPVNEFMDLLSV